MYVDNISLIIKQVTSITEMSALKGMLVMHYIIAGKVHFTIDLRQFPNDVFRLIHVNWLLQAKYQKLKG